MDYQEEIQQMNIEKMNLRGVVTLICVNNTEILTRESLGHAGGGVMVHNLQQKHKMKIYESIYALTWSGFTQTENVNL